MCFFSMFINPSLSLQNVNVNKFDSYGAFDKKEEDRLTNE